MLKFFKFPWAITGTRTAIPATDPGTGEMNYQTGYPAPYQLPKTDPASRNIERDKFNELMYDVTAELQLMQSYGVPDFITAALNGGVAFPYDVGATCLYLGRQYVSRKTANTSLPSVAADWSLVRLGGIPSATAGGTANAVTVDFVPDIGALVNGDLLRIEHTAINTGAVTVNPDATGALATYKGAGLALVAGDISGANFWGLYCYDASANALQLLNPGTGTGSITSRSAQLANGVPWVCPPGVTEILADAAAGGGAGGGASPGGGAGGGGGAGDSFLNQRFAVTPGVSYMPTIGTSGLGANNANGGAGGNTALGGLFNLIGGAGGLGAGPAAITNGGDKGGSRATKGGVGMSLYNGSTLVYTGGTGGGNLLSPSTPNFSGGSGGTAANGDDAFGYGGGGAGGYTGNLSGGSSAGGTGGAGYLFIKW